MRAARAPWPPRCWRACRRSSARCTSTSQPGCARSRARTSEHFYLLGDRGSSPGRCQGQGQMSGVQIQHATLRSVAANSFAAVQAERLEWLGVGARVIDVEAVVGRSAAAASGQTSASVTSGDALFVSERRPGVAESMSSACHGVNAVDGGCDVLCDACQIADCRRHGSRGTRLCAAELPYMMRGGSSC